jgi:TPP-dependent pyruvate/acetoin dehydrogenase alpha subunit
MSAEYPDYDPDKQTDEPETDTGHSPEELEEVRRQHQEEQKRLGEEVKNERDPSVEEINKEIFGEPEAKEERPRINRG